MTKTGWIDKGGWLSGEGNGIEMSEGFIDGWEGFIGRNGTKAIGRECTGF